MIVVVAWLLPGLPLLVAGAFAPVPMLLIAAPLAAALTVNVLHRLPSQWPAQFSRQAAEPGWTAWLAILGTALVAAGFIAWQVIMASASIIATRAPGVYFQTGYWIAQHGSLPIPGSLAAFGGSHPGLHLSSPGFFQQGHSVVPAVTSGLPMLLAGGFWTSGSGGGAVVGPVLGGLAVLSFGGLVGRLAGRRWAPAGALALALTLPEVYTSRDIFSGPAVQILLFGGISLVVDALTAGRGSRAAAVAEVTGPAEASAGEDVSAAAADADVSAESGAAAEALPRTLRQRLISSVRGTGWRRLASQAMREVTAEPMLAALGGLALGLTSLLSLSSLVLLLPVIAVAAVLVVARRAIGIAFCAGACVGCGYGIASGFLLARPLMDFAAPTLELIGRDAGGVALLTAAALLLRIEPGWLRFVGNLLARRPLRWLPGFCALLLMAGLGWLVVRPYLQTVHGVLGSGQEQFIAALQRRAGLKADPTRLYSEYSFWWVIWYAGIATVLLGGFGAALLLRRSLRALLSWRDDAGGVLVWALPLAVILGGSAAVLWQPFTTPDQPWASRRLVPVVIPGMILLATWAAGWLTRRARERGAGAVTAAAVGVFCVGAMAFPAVTTSFALGLTHSGTGKGLAPITGGLAQHRVGTGQPRAVRGLCSAIGRSSSVVIVDQAVADGFTQLIRGMCGVPVARISHGASVPQIDAVLGGIARAGRRPVVLGASPSQVGAFGGSPQLILHLATTQYPHTLTQPGAPWPARYVIWMVVATSPNADV